jgi:hypothetical protein
MTQRFQGTRHNKHDQYLGSVKEFDLESKELDVHSTLQYKSELRLDRPGIVHKVLLAQP